MNKLWAMYTVVLFGMLLSVGVRSEPADASMITERIYFPLGGTLRMTLAGRDFPGDEDKPWTDEDAAFLREMGAMMPAVAKLFSSADGKLSSECALHASILDCYDYSFLDESIKAHPNSAKLRSLRQFVRLFLLLMKGAASESNEMFDFDAAGPYTSMERQELVTIEDYFVKAAKEGKIVRRTGYKMAGIALVLRKNMPAAIEMLSAAFVEDRSDPDLSGVLVYLYARKAGNPRAALRIAEEKIEAGASWRDYLFLSFALDHSGRRQDAVRAVEKAIQNAPSDTEAIEAAAIIYAKFGEFDRASTLFRSLPPAKVPAKDSLATDRVLALAAIAYSSGRRDDAFDLLATHRSTLRRGKRLTDITDMLESVFPERLKNGYDPAQ